jgi:tellurite resistance protein
MAKSTTPKLSELEKQATAIRAELQVPRQNEVFRAAVEAGFLTALADGTLDDDEKATIVRAVEILSVGAVIEWEAETLVEECAARADKEGVEKRAAAVGAELEALGHPEAGLLFAATIARASKGVDKKEAELLKTIGAAAGLTPEAVKAIVKRAAG